MMDFKNNFFLKENQKQKPFNNISLFHCSENLKTSISRFLDIADIVKKTAPIIRAV